MKSLGFALLCACVVLALRGEAFAEAPTVMELKLAISGGVIKTYTDDSIEITTKFNLDGTADFEMEGGHFNNIVYNEGKWIAKPDGIICTERNSHRMGTIERCRKFEKDSNFIYQLNDAGNRTGSSFKIRK